MITIKLCGKILNYILEVLLLNKLSVSERFVFCAAIFFVYLAVKESEISLIDDLKNTWISKLLLSSSYSSLIFNVSCGAIATFIFWFIDIFIPRHQSINRCRKYVPKWKEYLEAHSFELSNILNKLGERSDGKTRITLGAPLKGINDSIDIGVKFPNFPAESLKVHIQAINTVVTDVRNYESSLEKLEINTVHELHIELIKYMSFLSSKVEVGSSKDYESIKIIRNKVNELLSTNIFK